MTALSTDQPSSTEPSTAEPSTAEPSSTERRRPGPVARVLLAVVRFYRTFISPALPPSCRYTPSCSAYAAEAIELHGAARGSWLALRRLLRCHPFHAGGHDPVPLPVATAGSMSRPTSTAAQPVAEE